MRRPKVHLVDTGLLCHLLNVDEKSLGRIESRELGPVTETYVVNELRKQATWAEVDVRLCLFRESHGNSEVDVIAETRSGEVIGIEVKAALTVTGRDFGIWRISRSNWVATSYTATSSIWVSPRSVSANG